MLAAPERTRGETVKPGGQWSKTSLCYKRQTYLSPIMLLKNVIHISFLDISTQP